MTSPLPDPHRQPEFYASVNSKRLVAWLVDTLVILGLSLIVVLLTAFVGLFIWPLLYLTVGFAYRVVTIANGSATWGMQFVGVELRNAHGEHMDLGLAFAHTLGYSISIAIPIIQVVSIVLMLTSARCQGLTDAFLGTVMLNRRG